MRDCAGGDEVGPWRVGIGGGYANTHLEFPSGGRTLEGSFTKGSVLASIERRLGSRWTVGGALGASVTGSLVIEHMSLHLLPGPLAALTASFRALDEGKIAPFLLFTGSLGASLAWTNVAGGAPLPMTALDARIGVAAGKTIANRVTPYVLARAFGGPVFWNVDGGGTVGTDAYHYQLGAGVVVRAGRIDGEIEAVPLGERALIGGVGVAF